MTPSGYKESQMPESENQDERVAGASQTPPPAPEESSHQLPPPPGPYAGPPVAPPPPGRWHRVRGWGARRPVQLVGAGLIGAIIGGAVVGAFGAVTGEDHGHYRVAPYGRGSFGWGPWGGKPGPMPYIPCFEGPMPGGPDQGGGQQYAEPGPHGWGPMVRCKMLPPQQEPVQPPQGQPSPASPAPPATATPVPSPSKS